MLAPRCPPKWTGVTCVSFNQGIRRSRCRFSTSTSKNGYPRDPAETNDVLSSRFAYWCQNHGVTVSKIRPFKLHQYGRGFKASASITKGELVMSYPMSFTINRYWMLKFWSLYDKSPKESTEESEYNNVYQALWKELFQLPPSSENDLLLLHCFVTIQRELYQSYFADSTSSSDDEFTIMKGLLYHYVSCLPRVADGSSLLVNFEENEVELLKFSILYRLYVQDKNWYHESWLKLMDILHSSGFAGSYPKNTSSISRGLINAKTHANILSSFMDLSHFRASFSILRSRCFGDMSSAYVMPFVDLFNHDPSCALEDTVHLEHNNTDNFYASKSYEEGDEVGILYGAFSNLDLLVRFGFVIGDNPHDYAPLKFSISEKRSHTPNSISYGVLSCETSDFPESFVKWLLSHLEKHPSSFNKLKCELKVYPEAVHINHLSTQQNHEPSWCTKVVDLAKIQRTETMRSLRELYHRQFSANTKMLPILQAHARQPNVQNVMKLIQGHNRILAQQIQKEWKQ